MIHGRWGHLFVLPWKPVGYMVSDKAGMWQDKFLVYLQLHQFLPKGPYQKLACFPGPCRLDEGLFSYFWDLDFQILNWNKYIELSCFHYKQTIYILSLCRMFIYVISFDHHRIFKEWHFLFSKGQLKHKETKYSIWGLQLVCRAL